MFETLHYATVMRQIDNELTARWLTAPSGAEPVFSGCQRGVGKLVIANGAKTPVATVGIVIVAAVRRYLIPVALMVFGTLTAAAVKAETSYVGNAACAGCHERANADWADSSSRSGDAGGHTRDGPGRLQQRDLDYFWRNHDLQPKRGLFH